MSWGQRPGRGKAGVGCRRVQQPLAFPAQPWGVPHSEVHHCSVREAHHLLWGHLWLPCYGTESAPAVWPVPLVAWVRLPPPYPTGCARRKRRLRGCPASLSCPRWSQDWNQFCPQRLSCPCWPQGVCSCGVSPPTSSWSPCDIQPCAPGGAPARSSLSLELQSSLTLGTPRLGTVCGQAMRLHCCSSCVGGRGELSEHLGDERMAGWMAGWLEKRRKGVWKEGGRGQVGGGMSIGGGSSVTWWLMGLWPRAGRGPTYWAQLTGAQVATCKFRVQEHWRPEAARPQRSGLLGQTDVWSDR